METNYTYTTDIAIVGGGVSGIYTAWRLIHGNLSESEILKTWAAKRPDGKLKIGVFERSSRIGGRLLSLTPPGMPNMRAELGAMHYTSNQILLRSFHNCTLENNTTGIELHFQNNSTVRCRRLILAMPRRSLELLDRTNSILDPNNVEVRQMIESVSPQPLLKIFLCYNNPWWQAASVHSGKSNTDLPVRQCYYIGTEGDQPGADQSNRNSLMMASYDDGRSLNFWIGMRKQNGEQPDNFQGDLRSCT